MHLHQAPTMCITIVTPTRQQVTRLTNIGLTHLGTLHSKDYTLATQYEALAGTAIAGRGGPALQSSTQVFWYEPTLDRLHPVTTWAAITTALKNCQYTTSTPTPPNSPQLLGQWAQWWPQKTKPTSPPAYLTQHHTNLASFPIEYTSRAAPPKALKQFLKAIGVPGDCTHHVTQLIYTQIITHFAATQRTFSR